MTQGPDIPELEPIHRLQAEQRQRVVAGREMYGRSSVEAGPRALVQQAIEENQDEGNYLAWAREWLDPGPQGQLRIYIAGPYRAPTRHGIVENIQRAREATAALYRMGHTPFCPHSMTSAFEVDYPDIGDETYIRTDLQWLSFCHAILLLPGWEHSAGTQTELEAARRMRLTIYRKLAEVPPVTAR